MINSTIKCLDSSEAIMTVGQVILHYHYNRSDKDAFNSWYVGVVKPIKEFDRIDAEIEKETSMDRIDEKSIIHWKVDGKNTAEIVLDKLLQRGFSFDRDLIKSGYVIEPISQYHVYLYRKC